MTDGFGDATVYRAGTTTFRVLSDNAALLELLDDLWRHCRTSQRAIHTLELVSTPNGYLVGVDGVVTVTGVPDETVLSRMVWEVNALVRGAPSAALLVHAGVVQLGQVGVLVCGASGAGKSTLTAALCERGAGYLTDEVALLRDDENTIDAYPKPISLRPESWQFMNELTANCAADVAHFMQDTWFVTPERALVSTELTHILFVSVAPGGVTSIEAMHSSYALVALSEQTHELRSSGEAAFRRLANLARSTQALRVSVGLDLNLACRSVMNAVSPS